MEENVTTLPYSFSSDNIPILYHYTSAQAACAIAESHSIWLSEYSAMNDASEFVHGRDQLMALMRDRVSYVGDAPRYCIASALAGLTQNTGLMIGSLTARRDDLSQWRFYSCNASGCVLGIDARYLEHDAGVAVRTVLYDEQEVRRLLLAGLSVVQQAYEDEPQNLAQLTDLARHFAADLFTIKHPSFADEREIRISRMLNRVSSEELKDVGGNRSGGGCTPPLSVATRNSPRGPTRYVALPLLCDDGSSAITSVGLGPAIASPAAAELGAYFRSIGLQVWRSTLPYRA